MPRPPGCGKDLLKKYGIPIPKGPVIEEKRDIRSIWVRIAELPEQIPGLVKEAISL